MPASQINGWIYFLGDSVEVGSSKIGRTEKSSAKKSRLRYVYTWYIRVRVWVVVRTSTVRVPVRYSTSTSVQVGMTRGPTYYLYLVPIGYGTCKVPLLKSKKCRMNARLPLLF
jgi:hypothetical protein